jgi:ATPase subunit of ABC transporter with duplicated ATPase domains
VGYFAQNQAEYLDGEITLLETMQNAATDTNRAKVRDMLGSFLFPWRRCREKGQSALRRRKKPSGYVNSCCSPSMYS